MKRVLLLVLDAAEPALIEQWIATGDLPHLKALKSRSAYGRVIVDDGMPAESLPFAFYAGQGPATHGVHGSVVWDPVTMSLRPPSAKWLPIQPFWRAFAPGGPRAVVLDAANCYAPEPFNGVEIVGWATDDLLAPFGSYPPDRAAWVEQHYGAGKMPSEIYDTFDKEVFTHTRDVMLGIASQFAGLCTDLMAKERWEFFLAYLSATHHGGHRLWDTTNINEPLSDPEQAELSDALRQVYVASDQAVGRIVAQAGPDTVVMVMSMHGMGCNRSRGWILPDLLRLVLREGEPRAKSFSWLRSLRESVPVQWRHAVKSRLPYRWKRWLSRFWRSGYDWTRTRAFTLMSDTQGWVRINLKGREARGIVEPRDYDALCERIGRGLKSFRDADSGEPIVADVVRSSQWFAGARQDLLPDLIIRWAGSPASQHRAVTSPEFGTVPWPTPGQNPEGRSGNHLPEGFLVMAGPGIEPGRTDDLHVLDLAPGILTLLGQPVPATMEGQVRSIFRN